MKLAIFIPGIGLEPREPSLEKYARLLQKAIVMNSPMALNGYDLRMTKERFGGNGEKLGGNREGFGANGEKFGANGEGEVKVATLKMKRSGGLSGTAEDIELYKIYEFDYVSLLGGGVEKKTSLPKFFHSTFTQSTEIVHFFKSLFRPSENKNLSYHHPLHALKILLSTKFLCLDSYLTHPERKALITGKFETLLEYVAKMHPDITGMEIHAYSFGSIISYDIIFPAGRAPAERIRSSIGMLLTIGSPHDFLKNYYPTYFGGRKRYRLALNKWYNIYSPADILSSNFRHDAIDGPATSTIIPGTIMPENINGYWGPDNDDAANCLTRAVGSVEESVAHSAEVVLAPSI